MVKVIGRRRALGKKCTDKSHEPPRVHSKARYVQYIQRPMGGNEREQRCQNGRLTPLRTPFPSREKKGFHTLNVQCREKKRENERGKEKKGEVKKEIEPML